MDDLLTMSRPPMQARRYEVAPAVLVALLLTGLFALAAVAVRMPETVSVTVDNPLPWRVEVSAQSAGSDAWTGLGSVSRDGNLTFLEFPDQGSEWVLRFSYAGETEQLEISRDQLAAQDWTIEVPQALATRLEAAGVSETTGSSAGNG